MKDIVKDMNVVPEQALVLDVIAVNVQKHKYSDEANAAHYEYEIVLAADEKNSFLRYAKDEDDELVVVRAHSLRINHKQLLRIVKLGGATTLDHIRQRKGLNWSDQATWAPMVGGKVSITVTPYSEGDTYTIEEDGEEIEIEYENDGCKVEVVEFKLPKLTEHLISIVDSGYDMTGYLTNLFKENISDIAVPKIEKKVEGYYDNELQNRSTLENVLIVSKTRMQNGVCVGGIVEGTSTLIRIHGSHGENLSSDAPYEIGDRWSMIVTPAWNARSLPHSEDRQTTPVRKLENVGMKGIVQFLLYEDNVNIIRGNIIKTFSGCLNFDGNKNYVNEVNVPSFSTQFWIADQDLYKVEKWDKVYYRYSDRDIKFVGFQEPIDIIPQGTIIRLSLANWWDGDGSGENRCYLQLSGWYL